MEGIARGVMANVLESDIVDSEFEFQSIYYISFLTNALGKRYKFFFLTSC